MGFFFLNDERALSGPQHRYETDSVKNTGARLTKKKKKAVVNR